MLGETLNTHLQIDCSGEIFNSFAASDGLLSNEVGYGGTMATYWRWRHRPNRKGTTVAVGTLIHRWQAELFPGLWELTRGLHTRFIVLYRENLLRHFISELIAMQTGRWTSDPATLVGIPRVTVDPEALRIFVATRYRERAEDWRFQPRIEYSMERLMRDWEAVSTRIQQFIGVSQVPLVRTKQKQETRKLSDILANYDEVVETVAQLKHPEWLDQE